MVLISIHPFALRRLFLVVLVLCGFSALCFADPVLMARRFGAQKTATVTGRALANGNPVRATDRQQTTQPADLAWPTAASVPGETSPGLLSFGMSLSSTGQLDLRTYASARIASDFLLTTTTTE